MVSINFDNVSAWCKGTAIVFAISSLVLGCGLVGEIDERFIAMLNIRAEYFAREPNMLLGLLEMALLLGMIVTLWLGSIWYLPLFIVQTLYFVISVDSNGPFLWLGVVDALFSVLVSISEAFGAALVLIRVSTRKKDESVSQVV